MTFWHNSIQCIFSLFRNNLSVKNGSCTPSETSKSSCKFKKNSDALHRSRLENLKNNSIYTSDLL